MDQKKGDDSENSEDFISKLPDDILLCIINKLPIKSLMHCRCVSRAWHELLCSAAPENQSRIICRKSTLGEQSIYLVDDNDEFDITPLIISGLFYTKPCSSDQVIVHSINGLLCLQVRTLFHNLGGYPVFVFNPMTYDHDIILPRGHRYHDVAFGFSPQTNEYKILRSSISHRRTSRLRMHVQICTIEYTRFDNNFVTWKKIGTVEFLELSSGVFLDGNLHWSTGTATKPSIRAFDVGKEEFYSFPPPPTGEGGVEWCTNSIGVVRGCLYLCATGRQKTGEVIEIWTMKNHNVKESWSRDFVIRFDNTCNLHLGCHSLKVYDGDEGVLFLTDESTCLFSYDPQTNTLNRLPFPSACSRSLVPIAYVPNFASFKDLLKTH